MADPTANPNWDSQNNMNADISQLVTKTAEAMVLGAMAAVDVATGKLEFMDDTVDLVPIGVIKDVPGGDKETLTGDGTRQLIAKTGERLMNIAVTGVTAITDIFAQVYMTDGQTFTLTKPTTGLPVGFIARFRSAGYADVQLYSLEANVINSRVPEKEEIFLGNVMTNLLQGNAAKDMVARTMHGRGTIDALYAYPAGIDNAAVAGAQTFNLEIGTTNTTGGVLTLGFGNCDAEADIGVKVSATAITTANTFSEGEVVTLELVTGGTGFTADVVAGFNVYMTITRLAGA